MEAKNIFEELINLPIYGKINIDNIEIFDEIFNLDQHFSYKGYCKICKEVTNFSKEKSINKEKQKTSRIGGAPTGPNLNPTEIIPTEIINERRKTNFIYDLKQNFFNYPCIHFNSKCSCCMSCEVLFLFYIKEVNQGDYILQKIGQSTSNRDLFSKNMKNYKKVIPSDYEEYKKAMELYNFGFGIGSFVYYRRIIENLIRDIYEIVKENEKWSEIQDKEFFKLKFEGKVNQLKSYISNDVIDFIKPSYEILSAGIHELDEEICLFHTKSLKTAIELILDDKISAIEREKKIKDGKIALLKSQSEVSNEIKKRTK